MMTGCPETVSLDPHLNSLDSSQPVRRALYDDGMTTVINSVISEVDNTKLIDEFSEGREGAKSDTLQAVSTTDSLASADRSVEPLSQEKMGVMMGV
jgi:hypothetical protein